jgi:hypothetical protein
LGVAGGRFGFGLDVSRLLHHQKPPAPNIATRITPTIATLMAQRTANFAIKTKIASTTTPAMIKMVVKLIELLEAKDYLILERQLFGS